MAFAVLFDSVGFGEWFVLLAVVLVVVGPRNLPSTARKIGSYYSRFRRAAESFKRQLLEMDTEFDNAVSSAAKGAESSFGLDGSMDSVDDPTSQDWRSPYDEPSSDPDAGESPAGGGDEVVCDKENTGGSAPSDGPDAD